jgi:5-methyltetrahydropteroyltriglutamate--homocysteine methyltransferase
MTPIRTTHTGSLPRPPEILAALRANSMDETLLARTVSDVVRKQVEAGIDIVTDGEMGKPSFFHYLSERLEGFAPREPKVKGRIVGPMDLDGRDATRFPDYYRGFLEHSPCLL